MFKTIMDFYLQNNACTKHPDIELIVCFMNICFIILLNKK